MPLMNYAYENKDYIVSPENCRADYPYLSNMYPSGKIYGEATRDIGIYIPNIKNIRVPPQLEYNISNERPIQTTTYGLWVNNNWGRDCLGRIEFPRRNELERLWSIQDGNPIGNIVIHPKALAGTQYHNPGLFAVFGGSLSKIYTPGKW